MVRLAALDRSRLPNSPSFHPVLLACKTLHDRPDLLSNVEGFCQAAEAGGLDLSEYDIEFFTFAPDPTGYVAVLRRFADGQTQCAWSNVPDSLDMHLSSVAGRGVKCAAVGRGGSWVVILEDGSINWRNIPQTLADILSAPLVNGPVEVRELNNIDVPRFLISREQFVALSLSASDQYFVVYANGTSDYSLPQEWHSVVDSYRPTTPPASPSSYYSSGYSGYSSPQHSPQSPFPPYGSGYPSYFNNTYSMSPQMPTYSAPQSQGGGSGIASASNIKTGIKILSGLVKLANAMQGNSSGFGGGGGFGNGGFGGGGGFGDNAFGNDNNFANFAF